MSNATLRNSVGHAVSATPRGLFIDGRTVATGARDLMEIRSPGTGEVIESVRLCSVEDVDAAVQSAAQAFRSPDWAKLSVRTRARLVNKLADVMEAHLEELYELETLNNGRPIRETRAQLARVPDLFRYNAGLALAKRDDVIRSRGSISLTRSGCPWAWLPTLRLSIIRSSSPAEISRRPLRPDARP